MYITRIKISKELKIKKQNNGSLCLRSSTPVDVPWLNNGTHLKKKKIKYSSSVQVTYNS